MGAPLRPKGHHSELSTRAPAPLGNPLRCLAAALIAWAIYLTTLVVIDARDTPASTESLTTVIEGALVVAATIYVTREWQMRVIVTRFVVTLGCTTAARCRATISGAPTGRAAERERGSEFSSVQHLTASMPATEFVGSRLVRRISIPCQPRPAGASEKIKRQHLTVQCPCTWRVDRIEGGIRTVIGEPKSS